MTILPLVGVFYFLNESVNTSLNLGFNSQLTRVLDLNSKQLKALKKWDPQNSEEYKKQFEDLENLRFVYANPELMKNSVSGSLKIFFFSGIILTFIISILISIILSRKISTSYDQLFNEHLKNKERLKDLEKISSWQDMARMFAHEIKNPLTPIELVLSSLRKSIPMDISPKFKTQFTESELIIYDELAHLKQIVSKFSEFSRLSKPALESIKIIEFLEQQIKWMSLKQTQAIVQLITPQKMVSQFVNLDPTLMRQVIANIFNNGIEANPDLTLIQFDIELKEESQNISIQISNNGKTVPPLLAKNIFEPYVSTHKNKQNMGLGLTIVKKIILDHGGDISYLEINNRPCFQITLAKGNSI